PRRLKIIGGAAPHHQGETGFRAQLFLFYAEPAEHLGARPLREFEIIGVVDEPGCIGVLVIDTDGEEIGAVAHGAIARQSTGHGASSSSVAGTTCASKSSCEPVTRRLMPR